MKLPLRGQSTRLLSNPPGASHSALTRRRKFSLMKIPGLGRKSGPATPADRLKSFRRERRARAVLNVLPDAKITPLRRRLHLGRMRNVTTLLLLISVITAGGYIAYTHRVWQVKQVQIDGEITVLGAKTDSLRQELTGANLITLDSDKYISELKSDPYVKSAYLRKEYPGKVIVAVEEIQPYMYIYTLNNSHIYGENGKALATRKAGEDYPISEVERLIYINERPFRSDLLKDRWLADNLIQLQEQFTKYKANQPESHRLKQVEELMTAGKISAPDQYTETMEFKDFVDNNFVTLPLTSLSRSYNQIRSEIVITVDKRWQELQTEVPAQPEQPIVYSLIETNEIQDLNHLIAIAYFESLYSQTTPDLSIKQLVFISPITVKLQVQSSEGRELTILISTQKPLDQQMIELRTLLATLNRENKDYKKIDLTGKKLVVS